MASCDARPPAGPAAASGPAPARQLQPERHSTMKFKDYYEIARRRSATATPGRNQEGLPQARAQVPPRRQQGGRCRGALQGDQRGQRGAAATPRSAPPTTRWARTTAAGQEFRVRRPGWDAGFEFRGRGDEGGFGTAGDFDASEFFETLFGRHARQARGQPRGARRASGEDHHAKVMIDLEDAYRGARRSISLRMPVVDAQGHVTLEERRLDVNIPKGIRAGQHLRLAGQGGQGIGGAPAGDLYPRDRLQPAPALSRGRPRRLPRSAACALGGRARGDGRACRRRKVASS